jgi:hypothetical protein
VAASAHCGQSASPIANHVHAHRLGVIFVAPLDVVFTQHDVVEPDVLFFTPE